MDYEVLKIIALLLCSTGGLFWTINKVSIALINRHQHKEFKLKNEYLEIYTKGYSMPEAQTLFKQLPKALIKEQNVSNFQLIKSTKNKF